MMGHQAVRRGQTEVVNLEEFIPQDHLLRAVDRYLNLADFRRHLSEFYSHTGRPSVDPELIIRMLIIGYCYGIRSERRLCEEDQVGRGKTKYRVSRLSEKRLTTSPQKWMRNSLQNILAAELG